MAGSNWIASLDVQKFVQTMMQQESANIDLVAQKGPLAQLNSTKTTLNTQLSNYGQIQNSLTKIKADLDQLNAAFNPTYQVAYSATGIANVAVNGVATPGTHKVVVTQLAKASSIASGVQTSTTTALNKVETLNFTVGPELSPTASMDVSVAGTDTLQTISDKINDSAKNNNLGIRSSIINTGTNQYKLIITSTQTGSANQVNIGETITSGGGLSVVTGSGGNATVLTSAQDAEFTYDDNLTFTQASNTAAIQGMTVDLISQGTTYVTLTPTSQAANITNTLKSLVSDYNDLDSFIEKSQISSGNSDAVLGSVLSQVQQAMKAVYSGNDSGSFTSLFDIGVIPNSDSQQVTVALKNGNTLDTYLTGQLKIDTDKLSSALASNLPQVQNLISGASGILTDLGSKLAKNTGAVWKTLNSTDGAIASTQKKLSDVNKLITDQAQMVDDQKNTLLLKYSQLTLTLAALQGQGQYVQQQITLLNKS